MKAILKHLMVGTAVIAMTNPVLAGGYFTPGLPYATTTTGSELIPADTGLPNGQNPQTEAIPLGLISAASNYNQFNYIIGGDFGTNLWQRGTSSAGGSISATYGYTADRFFAWGGSSSTIQVSQVASPSGITNFADVAKIARTGSGVTQVCFAQEVASSNAISLQGSNVELDFHAIAGAGFSAAASNLAVYVISGTGTDDGAQKMAYSINAGGGGSSGWTGATFPVNGASQIISTTAARYTAFGAIPSNATEVGVAICWTPVGGSPSNDYVDLGGIQLTRYQGTPQVWFNPQSGTNWNGQNASGPTSLLGTVNNSNSVPNSPFARRPAAQEAYLQYTYYQQWADSLAATFVLPETCTETTSGTTATCLFNFPVPMRTATPTVTIATAASFGMTKVADGTAEACTTFAVVASTATANNVKLTCAASETAAVGTMHIGLYAATAAANTLTVSSEL